MLRYAGADWQGIQNNEVLGNTKFPEKIHKLHYKYGCLKVDYKTRVLFSSNKTGSKPKYISLAKMNRLCLICLGTDEEELASGT
jgi:hypothetical protein